MDHTITTETISKIDSKVQQTGVLMDDNQKREGLISLIDGEEDLGEYIEDTISELVSSISKDITSSTPITQRDQVIRTQIVPTIRKLAIVSFLSERYVRDSIDNIDLGQESYESVLEYIDRKVSFKIDRTDEVEIDEQAWRTS